MKCFQCPSFCIRLSEMEQMKSGATYKKKIENETIACMNNEDQLHILKSRHSCRRNISHSQFFLLIIINTSSVIEGKTNEDFLLDGNYTTHLETEDDNGRHNFN